MTAEPVHRLERPADASSVRAVLEAAFEGKVEADLVERLRMGGHLIAALVAEDADGVVGYVAFPRLGLSTHGRAIQAVGLAPLGITPRRQRQGIGNMLVRAGLAQLQAAGERIVFVLGAPAYYDRFGFKAMDGYVSPYAGPYFQTIRLAADAPVSGIVTYPAPFAELG